MFVLRRNTIGRTAVRNQAQRTPSGLMSVRNGTKRVCAQDVRNSKGLSRARCTSAWGPMAPAQVWQDAARILTYPNSAASMAMPANQFAAFSLSTFFLGIGTNMARFHAHMLKATARHTPLIAAIQDIRPTPAIIDPTSSRNVPTQMPLDVLASTCDRQPHFMHSAGLARSDQRFANSVMLSSWQRGQVYFIERSGSVHCLCNRVSVHTHSGRQSSDGFWPTSVRRRRRARTEA